MIEENKLIPVRIAINSRGLTLNYHKVNVNDLREGFFDHSIQRQCPTSSNSRYFSKDDLRNYHESINTPAGLVFHVGRCGSTLLSQCLKESAIVFSEPSGLGQLLKDFTDEWSFEEIVAAVRCYFSELCRHFKRPVVIKLTSWHLLKSQILLAACPKSKVVVLTRDLKEVAASMAAAPPGWASDWLWAPSQVEGALSFKQVNNLVTILKAFSNEVESLEKLGFYIVDYTKLNLFQILDIISYLELDLPSNNDFLLKTLGLDSKDPNRVAEFQQQKRKCPDAILQAFES